MKKKNQIITGKEDINGGKSLSEIITGRKVNKFPKHADRNEYQAFLSKLDHHGLCEELQRLSQAPSCSKEFCRNKCLAIWDASQRPSVSSQLDQPRGTLAEILEKSRK